LPITALQSTGFALLGSHQRCGVCHDGQRQIGSIGIALPSPAAPVANYLPFVISGSLLVVSGQLAFGPNGKIDPDHTGKLGAAVSSHAGQAAARLCAINILAQAKRPWAISKGFRAA